MRIRTETYTLPAYWASYLINGDGSGLEDAEQARIDRWLNRHPELGGCLDCRDEDEFSRYNDAGELPGSTAEYVFPLLPGLKTLQKAAQKATKARGHRMAWTLCPGGVETSLRPFGHGTCRDCGAWVGLNCSPPANGIGVGGEAVAMNCTGKGASA